MEVGTYEFSSTTVKCKTEPTEEEEDVGLQPYSVMEVGMYEFSPSTAECKANPPEEGEEVSSDPNCDKPPDPIEMVCIKAEPLEEQEDVGLELYSEIEGECESPPTPVECKTEITEKEEEHAFNPTTDDSSQGADCGQVRKNGKQKQKRKRHPPIDPKLVITKVVGGGKTLECGICQYRSVKVSDLRRHVMTHTGERPFACSFCPSSFTQRNTLNTHMNAIHGGEKPFECKFCYLSFGRAYVLTEHLRTHTGERPFACRFCANAFSRASTLRKHLLTHEQRPATEAKPFSCEICSARFSEASHLRRHMKIHTGKERFECDRCSYKCSRKDQLAVHVRRHDVHRPFHCAHCSYSSTTKGQLVRHLSSEHRN